MGCGFFWWLLSTVAFLFLHVEQSAALEVLNHTNPSQVLAVIEDHPYGKYYGPVDHYDITAPAKLFDGDICELSADHNFTNMILVYKLDKRTGCSFSRQYNNAASTHAVAAIESWKMTGEGDVPGFKYHIHGGNRGGSLASETMVWVQVNKFKFSDVMKQLEKGQEVRLRLRPQPNPWRESYASPAFIGVLRVGLPILFLLGAGIGVWTLSSLRNTRQQASRDSRTQQLAVAIETVCLFVIALFLPLSGVYGSDILPFPVLAFFGTALPGWSFFTTFLVALHWREIRIASCKLRSHQSVLKNRPISLALVFIVFVGGEFVMGCLIATYQNSTILVFALVFLFTMSNLVTLVFFAFHCTRFLLMMIHHTNTNKSTLSNEIQQRYERLSFHMAKWLLATTLFMFLNITSFLMFLSSFAWTPSGQIVTFGVLYFSRWGTGTTQILAWRMPKKVGKAKQVTQEQRSNSGSIEILVKQGPASNGVRKHSSFFLPSSSLLCDSKSSADTRTRVTNED